jgi:hypothetical protein
MSTSTTQGATSDSQPEAPAPGLKIHSVRVLRDAYESQRKVYDWDFSKEREFMENLFCTRFNFLLVVYSLFVTAAAGSGQNRSLLVGVLFSGAILCGMVWLTIIRAYKKFMLTMRELYKLEQHPVPMIDAETSELGAGRLFRVNPIIAYWAPGFCVLSLLAGAVAALTGRI